MLQPLTDRRAAGDHTPVEPLHVESATRANRELWSHLPTRDKETDNDPSAGSPTETLLRLLLPLNAQVWKSFQRKPAVKLRCIGPNASLKRSIGSSDGRCVQRAGT